MILYIIKVMTFQKDKGYAFFGKTKKQMFFQIGSPFCWYNWAIKHVTYIILE